MYHQEQEELLIQWEPKVQGMSNRVSICGMTQEDIAQELRIQVLKTAEKFDPTRGVKFHTYLHWSLLHKISDLIQKGQKVSKEVELGDYVSVKDEEPLVDILPSDVTDEEKALVELIVSGFKTKEVKKVLGEDRYETVMGSLKSKCEFLLES